jgi:hypothetical protein
MKRFILCAALVFLAGCVPMKKDVYVDHEGRVITCGGETSVLIPSAIIIDSSVDAYCRHKAESNGYKKQKN